MFVFFTFHFNLVEGLSDNSLSNLELETDCVKAQCAPSQE